MSDILDALDATIAFLARREMPPPWTYAIGIDAPKDWARSQNDSQKISGRKGDVTVEQIMAVRDQLPKAVREALAAANHPWAPHWARSVLRLGFAEAAVIERLKQADREEAQRREVLLLRGQG